MPKRPGKPDTEGESNERMDTVQLQDLLRSFSQQQCGASKQNKHTMTGQNGHPPNANITIAIKGRQLKEKCLDFQ